MDHRLELQELLEGLLESKNVYFQPPENVKMTYPCFVYALEAFPQKYADDLPYRSSERYLVTYISRSSVSDLPKRMSETKGFSYDRRYVADNLHHTVFTYNFL